MVGNSSNKSKKIVVSTVSKLASGCLVLFDNAQGYLSGGFMVDVKICIIIRVFRIKYKKT